MENAIKNFAKQFEWKAEIQNSEALKPASKFLVGGMGGSHLSAGIIKIARPNLPLYVYRDYGLPNLSDIKERLLIASSYSGNTEETLDFLDSAVREKLNIAAVSTGGKLIELARKHKLPFILMPSEGIQPRMALGFSLLALSKLFGSLGMCDELASFAHILKPEILMDPGEKLAKRLSGKIPVIYSSTKNMAIAYNWKIKMNETGKIPAFYNVLPELNHNEMTGFDVIPATKKLSQNFCFLFLTDETDHPQIQKRMLVTKKLYDERGLQTFSLSLSETNPWEKVFNSLLLADWTALKIANANGAEAEQVPMVEEFKSLIA